MEDWLQVLHDREASTDDVYVEGYMSRPGSACPYEFDEGLSRLMIPLSTKEGRLTDEEREILGKMNNAMEATKWSRWTHGQRCRKEGRWSTYVQKTQPSGIFEWLIPSIGTPGITILAVGEAFARSYVEGAVPVLAGWDGHVYTMPSGTMWRPTDDKPEFANTASLRGVVDFATMDCPHCGKAPTLHGCLSGVLGSKSYRSSDMHRFNEWWMRCCEWGVTPSRSNPFDLEAERLSAYRKAAVLIPK